LNSKHNAVDKPEAPSLVVVDKKNGRLLAREDEGISQRIFHSTWSSPALGTVDGQRRIFFCGGDGICYAFPALTSQANSSARDDGVAMLKAVWRFDCDPGAPKENIHSYIRNRRESPSNIKSMPVFDQGRLYVTVGGDIWWGKLEAWLQCVDVKGEGDVTKTGLLWSYPVERHCCSTPAVHDRLAYVADCAGKVHCVDVNTGQPVWVHDAKREIWASPLVADGKVYVGNRRGEFWVLAAGRQRKVLSQIRLDAPVFSTAVAANGVLYVSTMDTLYALKQSQDAR
jgi:outer membrane protein assembly factor BamB